MRFYEGNSSQTCKWDIKAAIVPGAKAFGDRVGRLRQPPRGLGFPTPCDGSRRLADCASEPQPSSGASDPSGCDNGCTRSPRLGECEIRDSSGECRCSEGD